MSRILSANDQTNEAPRRTPCGGQGRHVAVAAALPMRPLLARAATATLAASVLLVDHLPAAARESVDPTASLRSSHAASGEPSRVINVLLQHVAKHPKDNHAWSLLVETVVLARGRRAAREMMARYRFNDVANLGLRLAWLDLLAEMATDEQSRSELERELDDALRRFPDSGQIWIRRGWLCLTNRDLDCALAAVARLNKAGKGQPWMNESEVAFREAVKRQVHARVHRFQRDGEWAELLHGLEDWGEY